jgi:hypothetical protein
LSNKTKNLSRDVLKKMKFRRNDMKKIIYKNEEGTQTYKNHIAINKLIENLCIELFAVNWLISRDFYGHPDNWVNFFLRFALKHSQFYKHKHGCYLMH